MDAWPGNRHGFRSAHRHRKAPRVRARGRASPDDAHRRAGSCRSLSRAAPPVDFIPDSTPPCALELGGKSTSPVAREVQMPPHRTATRFKAALQALLHQPPEGDTLPSSHALDLLQQLVGKLYGRLHTGHPYLRYCTTISATSKLGKHGSRWLRGCRGCPSRYRGSSSAPARPCSSSRCRRWIGDSPPTPACSVSG